MQFLEVTCQNAKVWKQGGARAGLFREVTTISLNIKLNKVKDVSDLLMRPFNSSVSNKQSPPSLPPPPQPAVMRIVQEDCINHKSSHN